MRSVLMVMAVAFMVSIPASAQVGGGGLAVGYDQDVEGISLRYMPGGLGFEGILGFGLTSPDDDDLDSAFDLNLGFHVLLPLATTNRFRLNGIGGFWVFLDQSENPNADSSTDLAFVVGVEPELFVLDSFSISTKMGVQLYLDDEPNDNGGTFFGTFGPDDDLFRQISIRYYF